MLHSYNTLRPTKLTDSLQNTIPNTHYGLPYCISVHIFFWYFLLEKANDK